MPILLVVFWPPIPKEFKTAPTVCVQKKEQKMLLTITDGSNPTIIEVHARKKSQIALETYPSDVWHDAFTLAPNIEGPKYL